MERVLAGLAVALLLSGAAASGQEQAPNRRDVTVVASDHKYSPDRIDVLQDDLVKITFRSDEARPYTFVIDAYRIVKRAAGGQTITFEFRADQPGTFPFYCNLTSDEACRSMKGTLFVKAK